MRQKILAVISVLLLSSFTLPDTVREKYLNSYEPYTRESFFKNEVYAKHDWRSFYQLQELNEVIDPRDYNMHLLNAALFFATNKYREEKKLRPFTYVAELRDAAVLHTRRMIEKKFFDHIDRLEHKIKTPVDRVQQLGYKGQRVGENVDESFFPLPSRTTYLQIAEDIVSDFHKSAPHRKNMASKQYEELGAAVILEPKDRQGQVWYFKATQSFGAQH